MQWLIDFWYIAPLSAIFQLSKQIKYIYKMISRGLIESFLQVNYSIKASNHPLLHNTEHICRWQSKGLVVWDRTKHVTKLNHVI